MKKILLVGGGTSGHFNPLMAIAEVLKERDNEAGETELLYMGPEPHDSAILDTLGIRFVYCPSGKVRRYWSIRNFIDPFKIIAGIVIALVKLFLIYPDVVMSKGSYTSVPVTIAARLLRIPIVIHESDSVPGRATKLNIKAAKYIAISYSESAQFFPQEKTALVGIPVRKALLESPTGNTASELGLDTSLPTLFVYGGSLGAESINNLILESLTELLPSYNIVHQTGREHFETVKSSAMALVSDTTLLSRYHPIAYVDAKTLNLIYHTAAIVISRAGSTTIFETALHGKPAIVIPIPETISHDQRSNAYAYARAGAAVVMEEGNVRDSLLVAEITRIMSDQSLYERMAKAATDFAPRGAAEKMADILDRITEEHT